MITVADLIEMLGKFPPDLRVVVRGYEEGVDDIKPPRLVRIALYVNPERYNGPHEPVQSGDVQAIFIGGARREEQYHGAAL